MVMEALDELAAEFWSWRAHTQPRLRDDIPRLERPAGWVPDFSAAAVAAQRARRDAFAAQLSALAPAPAADRVDARLLHSALSRVSWELDVVAAWQRQPRFYTDQTLGPVFDLLAVPGVDAARVAAVLAVLEAVGPGLAVARENLAGHAYAEFAQLAAAELDGIDFRLADLAIHLALVAPEHAGALRARVRPRRGGIPVVPGLAAGAARRVRTGRAGRGGSILVVPARGRVHPAHPR